MHYAIIFPVLLAWFVSAGIYFFLAHQLRYVYVIGLALVLSGLLTLGYLLADYFTGDGITDAVWFHLQHGLQSEGILAYPKLLLASIMVLLLVIGFVVVLARRSSRYASKVPLGQQKAGTQRRPILLFAHGLLFFSLLANPAIYSAAGSLIDGGDPVAPAIFARNLHPIQIGAAPARKKNLVYLYTESLERTFFDQEKFPSLITNLRSLEQGAVSFTELHQAKLTGWTIAGMTASQCGVPLTTFNWKEAGQSGEGSFSPGRSCLGDVLKANGYHLAYLGGADLSFAGKGRFYRSHGFDDVKGLHYFQQQNPDVPTSTWGVYDDTLLDAAYEKFVSLSKTSRPFGLFLLTLDTHQPSGHETPACRSIQYRDGSNKLLNAVACADVLVSRFIAKIEASPYAEDTLLIVGSDHLALRNDATQYLEVGEGEDRRNMLMMFNSGLAPQAIAKPGTTLDIAPTVLQLLGFKSGDFALGRNLLGTSKTLVEVEGIHRLNIDLPHWRKNALSLASARLQKN